MRMMSIYKIDIKFRFLKHYESKIGHFINLKLNTKRWVWNIIVPFIYSNRINTKLILLFRHEVYF